MIFKHLLRPGYFMFENIVYERTLIMTRTLYVFKYHYGCFIEMLIKITENEDKPFTNPQ